jgi:outer membrane receptor protein involved in Fe transport
MTTPTAAFGASAILLIAAPALAQPTPSSPRRAQAPPQQTAPKRAVEIVVTGQRSPLRTSIDRLSYDVANDLQTTTGSAADALRNVPGVEVDVQGNVSLRGDSNVTIMVDGRRSAQFEGDGRGDALQQYPADQIARIEVITNPGAGMSPEGTAGVINIVTRRTRDPGGTGSLRANASPDGRWNAGIRGSWQRDKLTLAGDLGVRVPQGEISDATVRSRLDQTSGRFIDQTTRGEAEIEGGSARNARLAADYDVSAQDRLSAELSHRGFSQELEGLQRFEERHGAGLVRAYDRETDTAFSRDSTEARGSWRRRFGEASQSADAAEHELRMDLQFERTVSERRWDGAFSNLTPPAPLRAERSRADFTSDETQLRLEYVTPLAGAAKLNAGLEATREENAYENFRAVGPSLAGLTVVPALTNDFDYGQRILSAFASYERPFGDITIQGGLRLEQVDIEIGQGGAAGSAESEYFRAYPTVFLSYELTESQRLRASYGRRIRRPWASDLNPLRIETDPQNLREGNPNLRPEITDSYEAGWQYRRGGSYYLATAFYRESKDGVTDVVRDIGGGVFLTTRENLGQSRRAGLELTANGRLKPRLTYNLSGTAQWTELESRVTGLPVTRDGSSLSARFSLNWQPTESDVFQINGSLNGEQLQPQGVRLASGVLNLGYRRRVNERVSVVATAQNVLDSFREEIVLETPTLRERSERTFMGPALFVGFTWAIGETAAGDRRRERDPGFEYDQGAPAG